MLVVALVAGFIEGVVKFSENWPKFCAIICTFGSRLHYWIYDFWLDQFDRISFKVLSLLYLPSRSIPDGDGPKGAPPTISGRRESAYLLTPSMRAQTILRVIEGGKDKVRDILVLMFGLAILIVYPALIVARLIHNETATLTHRMLTSVFGEHTDSSSDHSSTDALVDMLRALCEAMADREAMGEAIEDDVGAIAGREARLGAITRFRTMIVFNSASCAVEFPNPQSRSAVRRTAPTMLRGQLIANACVEFIMSRIVSFRIKQMPTGVAC